MVYLWLSSLLLIISIIYMEVYLLSRVLLVGFIYSKVTFRDDPELFIDFHRLLALIFSGIQKEKTRGSSLRYFNKEMYAGVSAAQL